MPDVFGISSRLASPIVNIAGIESPNPFWLASARPMNMGSMVERVFTLVGAGPLGDLGRTDHYCFIALGRPRAAPAYRSEQH